jgi:uncharacterized lipoprotein YddW (UPF0748 family)
MTSLIFGHQRISLLLALGAGAAMAASPHDTAAGDVNGMWVLRSSLTSPASIGRMVDAARGAGVNTLLVQVRGRGEAFYLSDIEPRASELASQPDDFDPLAVTLERAHAAGLQVHAWVNVNLVSSAATLPRSRQHVAARHPEWLMVPKELAGTLRATDPRSPAYIGALSRWSRKTSSRVEGLYLSPLAPGALDYTASVIDELVTRYAVDGLHLDYVRFPHEDFDYGPLGLAAFRESRYGAATAVERRQLDAAARGSATAWPDRLPDSWGAFRRERLTALVARITTSARATRPGLIVSAAVVPDAADAMSRKMQDWAGWAAAGYLDVVCPMLYTTSASEFVTQTRQVSDTLGETPMWAGIGAYRLPVARTAENVRAARREGAAGVLLFSYDSLVSPSAPSPAYLRTLRATLMETRPSDGAGR